MKDAIIHGFYDANDEAAVGLTRKGDKMSGHTNF